MEVKYQATFAERNKALDELTKQAQEHVFIPFGFRYGILGVDK